MALRVAAFNAHDQRAAVSAALQKCDLLLANEAVPTTRRPGWTVHSGGKGVLTAWRNDLWLSPPVSQWHRAHGGIAGVTPRRGSLVSDGVLRNGRKVRIINGHRINGTGWPGNRRRPFWRKRRKLWREHDAMDRRLMFAALHVGADVVLGADVNRTDMPKPHADAIPLRDDGITQLWYIPAATPPTLGDGGAVARLASGTKHRLQWRDLTI